MDGTTRRTAGLCTIPRHEHDACGVGFVANIKGERSHDIIEQGLQILAQPHASRRLRLRSADRRRRRHPDADARRVLRARCARARHHAARAAASTASAWCSCRASARRAQRVREHLREDRARGRPAPARLAATCRSTPARAAAWRATCMPEIRQIFIGRGRDTADEAALERKLYVIRKRVEQLVRELGLPRLGVVLRPEPLVAHHLYKGLLLPDQIPQFYHDLTDPRVRVARSRSSTSASAPTRSRPGTAPTPTATSRTTARSTRCAATSTGCTRASRCSPRRCSATTCEKLFPIIDAGGSDSAAVRQRARAAAAHRPLAAARRHDDDPRGLAEAREHERREAGLLPIRYLKPSSRAYTALLLEGLLGRRSCSRGSATPRGSSS